MKRAALISLLLCVVTPSLGVYSANNALNMAATVARDQYHPAAVQKPRLLEQFDKRYDDGHYEYSYTLSNGDKRYEHAYWQPVGNNNVLARKGYYSYPLPNNKFLTVFYTSDQNGFQQEFSSYTNAQPNLPRSIDIPQVPMKPVPVFGVPHVSSTPAPSYQQQLYVPQSEASSQVPNYILTSGAQHPWQSNRLRRHVAAHSEGERTHDTTTHDPHTESTTSHETNVISSTTQAAQTTQRTHASTIDVSHSQVSHGSHSAGVSRPGVPQSLNNIGLVSHYQPISNRVTEEHQTDAFGEGAPLAVQTFTHHHGGHGNQGSHQGHHGHQPQQTNLNQQQQPTIDQIAQQNALLAYLASRVSAESRESSSSESHEYYLPGIVGGHHGSGVHGGHHRRSGNRPIWRNQPTQHPLTTFGF